MVTVLRIVSSKMVVDGHVKVLDEHMHVWVVLTRTTDFSSSWLSFVSSVVVIVMMIVILIVVMMVIEILVVVVCCVVMMMFCPFPIRWTSHPTTTLLPLLYHRWRRMDSVEQGQARDLVDRQWRYMNR